MIVWLSLLTIGLAILLIVVFKQPTTFRYKIYSVEEVEEDYFAYISYNGNHLETIYIGKVKFTPDIYRYSAMIDLPIKYKDFEDSEWFTIKLIKNTQPSVFFIITQLSHNSKTHKNGVHTLIGV